MSYFANKSACLFLVTGMVNLAQRIKQKPHSKSEFFLNHFNKSDKNSQTYIYSLLVLTSPITSGRQF